jgi:hypothetical protein
MRSATQEYTTGFVEREIYDIFNFVKTGLRAFLCALALGLSSVQGAGSDVVVYGGTPGGIAAAISAARLGRTVTLVEYQRHLGGMSASGLSRSDVVTRGAIGGLFREFTGNVYRYYVRKYGEQSENVRLCQNGYCYEPSVAEHIFDQMVAAEPRLRVLRNHRLEEMLRTAHRVTGIRVGDRDTQAITELRGGIFIDASYEGDLAAYAGVACRVGRESRAEYNEPHAGVVYLDPKTRTLLPQSTGEGDHRIGAYTFRLCLSYDPANSYFLTSPPPDYQRARYTGYFDDLKAGRMSTQPSHSPEVPNYANTMLRAFTISSIPNHKTDVNTYAGLLGYPFPEENYGYPDGSWEDRERITQHLRNITLGLLWFLQNDPEIPLNQRQLARRFNLAKDEFNDNGCFPWQLYVREARRIVGLYTLSENDVTLSPGSERARVHRDSIAAGEYPIDSMPVRKRQPGDQVMLEGYLLMLRNITRPYQIPYRITVPERVEGLLVPVAASTTHIAFSSIRLEPTWMALGQAAGVAAHLALQSGVSLREIDIDRMQRMLLDQGQVLTYFSDADAQDPAWKALQYFGTLGFFRGYEARAHEPVSRATTEEWLNETHLPTHISPSGGPSLTRGELLQLLPGVAGWENPANPARNPQDPVWRGELCQALYNWLGHTDESAARSH